MNGNRAGLIPGMYANIMSARLHSQEMFDLISKQGAGDLRGFAFFSKITSFPGGFAPVAERIWNSVFFQ